LNAAFQQSEKAVLAIDAKISKITVAAKQLLDEWKFELKDYNDPELRQKSEAQFDATRDKLDQLVKTMRQAEEKTKPVLAIFRDHVLALKHNLNAKAIASLGSETVQMESDVDALIVAMEASIAEANDFLKSLEGI
jgi:hypothetical protein